MLQGEGEDAPPVLGFYTLSMTSVPSKHLRRSLGKKLPQYPMPVALPGRLAVHECARGRGLGQCLLGEALRQVATAGRLIGCVGVVVDAKNDEAELFYRRYGFVLIETAPRRRRLFLPMSTIQAGLPQ